MDWLPVWMVIHGTRGLFMEARWCRGLLKEDSFLLAESVHAEFVKALRQEGVVAASDKLYEASWTWDL